MRKELIVAIVTGILFGCLFAFGIWKVNSTLSAKENSPLITQVLPSQSISPTPTQSQKLDIEIVSPLENEVFTQKLLTVSGLTQPNIWLSITGENTYEFVKSQEDGTFKGTIELKPGLNKIQITSFDNEGKTLEKLLTVIYSTTFASITPASANGKPSAYVGVVTDKTGNSLQITEEKGSILLLSLDSEKVTVSKINAGKQNDANYIDVAIGDYIAALGFVTSNDVLDTKQILLTGTPANFSRKSIRGAITKVTSKNIIVQNKEGAEYIIEPSKTVLVTEGENQTKVSFSNLELDQTIIAIGSLSGRSMVAERIHSIQ